MSDNSIEFIFEETDPLGRKVVLKSTTWDEHIKDRHPEKGVDDIKLNISNPQIIIKDNEHTDREVYLRYVINNNKLYTNKTVVAFEEKSENGEVVTNYTLRKINQTVTEGGVIYDSSKN